MTVAVASHQRRRQLARLLDGLANELRSDGDPRCDIDVVVVLDGSSDGSREMIGGLEFPVPLEVIWQPNRGLAAARNAALRAASGRLVLFLDDDLTPGPGLLARHCTAHNEGLQVVLGPCWIPTDARTSPEARAWWASRYEALTAAGVITRFDQFTLANASGPTEVFLAVGGMDESFVGYGQEDYELGIRLLEAGTRIVFDRHAVAWHHQEQSFWDECRKRRSEGANAVRLAEMHPMTVDVLFPPGRALASARWLRRLTRSPIALHAASVLARSLAPVAGRKAPAVRQLARDAAYAAGVAAADRREVYLARLLQSDDP